LIDGSHVSPALQGRSSNARQTVVQRKVKDACIDLSNHSEEWICLNCKGLDIITTFANLRMLVTDGSEEESEQLNEHCDELKTNFDSMEMLVEKMERILVCLRGVVELESHQSLAGSDTSSIQSVSLKPIFQCYTSLDFSNAAEDLLQMFRKEVALKKTIVLNVGLAADHDSLSLYASAWQHQPYINDEQLTGTLRRLLEEIGIK